MLMKALVVIDPNEERIVSSLPLRIPLCIKPGTTLNKLLNLFQEGAAGNTGGHLALVCQNSEAATAELAKGRAIPKEAGLMGMVTMEDVIEEVRATLLKKLEMHSTNTLSLYSQLLQEEIYDETDKYEKIQVKRAKKVLVKWRNYIHKRRIEQGKSPGTITR